MEIGNWTVCRELMGYKYTTLSLLFTPGLGLASTGDLGDIYLGYFSIYVLMPILILLPTLKFVYLSIRKSVNRKLAYLSSIVSITSLLILFVLATQYFSFDFKFLRGNEQWEVLFLLVFPSYIFWFLASRKKDLDSD